MNNKNWEVLYHYTSLESFLRIISQGYIALNDVIKSNDPAEGKYSIEILEKAYKELYREEKINQDQFDKIRGAFFDFREEEYCFGRLKHVVLSLSVCEPEFPLALWRSYGDNGCGCAIGISKEKLKEIGEKEGFTFGKMNYYKECELIDKYKRFWLSHVDDEDSKLKNEILKEYKDGYFIKRRENNYENEWRLIYTGLDLDDFLLMPENVPESIDAYARRDDIVLFYKLSIKEPDTIIDNVYIGPNCKVTDNEMRLLLMKKDIGHISVSHDDTVMR
ncbi:DUF2971 domain-containing protein [Butyrivibrio fibrisolvens]|uniref:DUF2971 domain-containing protein n=1 Tax=Butyrivibrio fibrisolvens TaxID=831 RepID=UPI0003F9BAA6|nr:DUF2971 domain-containing protein [Butyrivibrio fibrisolvens]